MALQARVVGQDFARRQADTPRGAARWDSRVQHHRREADAIAAQFAAQCGPVFGGGHEVAAVGNQRADFIGHAAAQRGIAGAEGDHHRLRDLCRAAGRSSA